jgi:hypothetical protein
MAFAPPDATDFCSRVLCIPLHVRPHKSLSSVTVSDILSLRRYLSLVFELDGGCKHAQSAKTDTKNPKHARAPNRWNNKNESSADEPARTITGHDSAKKETENAQAKTVPRRLGFVGCGHVA